MQHSEEKLRVMFYQFVALKAFFFSAIINSVRISHLHGYLFKNVLYIPAVVLLSLPDFDKFFLSICMNASRVISD